MKYFIRSITMAGIAFLFSSSLHAQSHWQHVTVLENTQFGEQEFAIKAADSLDYVAGGSFGSSQVFRSTDGGLSWNMILGGPPYVFLTIGGLVHPSRNLIVILASGNYQSTLFRSSDGGKSWNITTIRSWDTTNPNPVAYTIASLDSSHIFLPTAGKTYHYSTDGGVNWKTIPTPTMQNGVADAAYTGPNTITIMQADSAYAYTHLYTFYRTTNLGASWTRGITTTHDISKMYFLNPLLGFAAGFISDADSFNATGTIDRTTDGGLTWTNVYTHRFDSLAELYNIAFADSLNGIAVGQSGVIVRTRDGGTTWKEEISDFPRGSFDMLDGVAFPTLTHAVITSSTAEALVYRPQGLIPMPVITYPRYTELNGVPPTFDVTWDPVAGATSYYIKVFVGGPNTIYALDSNITTTHYHLSNLPANTPYTLYVQARNGAMRSNTAEGGFTVIASSVKINQRDPLAQYLYVQNYPNPAQDYFHVRLSGIYSNPGASLTAELLDILGRKVMDLSDLAVHGNNGTTSEFEVYVANLPAGVYTLHYTLGPNSYGRSLVIVH